MKNFFLFFFLVTSCIGHAARYSKEISPEGGVQLLIKGNQRFVDGKLLHPSRDQERRDKTAIAQKPFGIIVSCSDSRVAPEILFDQGIGDLFIIRIAGNIVGPTEMASIGYAALYLGSNVLFILGHENCGAVDAVLDGNTKDIEPIARLIAPAVKGSGGNLEVAVKDNVKAVVAQMEAEPIIANLLKKKKFSVVGGYYNLGSGKVEMLDDKKTNPKSR